MYRNRRGKRHYGDWNMSEAEMPGQDFPLPSQLF